MKLKIYVSKIQGWNIQNINYNNHYETKNVSEEYSKSGDTNHGLPCVPHAPPFGDGGPCDGTGQRLQRAPRMTLVQKRRALAAVSLGVVSIREMDFWFLLN